MKTRRLYSVLGKEDKFSYNHSNYARLIQNKLDSENTKPFNRLHPKEINRFHDWDVDLQPGLYIDHCGLHNAASIVLNGENKEEIIKRVSAFNALGFSPLHGVFIDDGTTPVKIFELDITNIGLVYDPAHMPELDLGWLMQRITDEVKKDTGIFIDSAFCYEQNLNKSDRIYHIQAAVTNSGDEAFFERNLAALNFFRESVVKFFQSREKKRKKIILREVVEDSGEDIF